MIDDFDRFSNLVIMLGSSLHIEGLNRSVDSISEIRIGGKTFKKVEDNPFTGFYDWLRSTDNKIIGVRLFPMYNAHALLRAIPLRPYLRILENGKETQIFFGDDRQFDDRLSDDQAFCENEIYRAEDGVYAISFQNPNKGI